MDISNNVKIEAQKKMIEQLTQENMDLKEKLLYQQIRIEELEKNEEIIQHERLSITASIQEVLDAKKQYEELMSEIAQLKNKYVLTYSILDKLHSK